MENKINLYLLIKKNLELTDQETKIFLFIIVEGKKNLEEISCHFNYSLDNCEQIILSLITKGILLEYSTDLYESFHPRFVVTNRYKKLCHEKKVEFKKSKIIDNLGLILEKYYDIVRTK